MSELEKKIKSMYMELKNPRNDGWIQKSNLDSLLSIKELILSFDLEKEKSRFDIEIIDIKNHIDE
tara:strand:+ start:2811 stop:3005 length:195 start_codon:yes stop_codon:yes gene_type:complete